MEHACRHYLQEQLRLNRNARSILMSRELDSHERVVHLHVKFDAKSQVLANLANFAYDPINYSYIRDVGVLDIFLYVVKKETDPKLLHFACAGISNLCIDPLNIEYLLTNGAVPPLLLLLKCDHNDIVADVITILIYLNNCGRNIQLYTPEVIQQMESLKHSTNKMIANLATIFLNDINTE